MKNKENKIIKVEALSLSTKVEQIAKLLRKEAKELSLQKNQTVISSAPKLSATNLICQVAKRLRAEIHTANKKKKAA